MKRFYLLITALALSFSLMAQFRPLEKRRHKVNKALKQLVATPDFKTAGFAFLAQDVNSGEIIAAHNPDMALRPASTLKLLTTATVLELLSPDYRYTTLLEYSGNIDTVRHLLDGNLIIKGGGDPTLGSVHFDQTKSKQFLQQWKEAVRKLGINSITGSIVADASLFGNEMVPPSWSWQNMGNYFGAGPRGLTIEDNSYAVYFNTDNKVGDTATLLSVSPTIPNLILESHVTGDSVNYDNSNIFGAPYCNRRVIRGELPVGRNRFKVKGSMPDPAFIAAWQLDSALNADGISISGAPTTLRRLHEAGSPASFVRVAFDTILSPPLSQIIAQTNLHSINLFAEHCALSAGMALGAMPETTTVMDSIVSYWYNHGMDTEGMRLTDGSGLSQYDVITPRQMVFLLSYMKNRSRWFDAYYQSFAVGGETGTLEAMFPNSAARGNIRAKSGTIDGAKAYSGYVTSKSGRQIAFSMMVNNFSCSSHEAKAKLEYLMNTLAEFDR